MRRNGEARFELVVDALWVAFSAWYLATALTYPPAARLVPAILGAVALAAALAQLLGHRLRALHPWTQGQPPGADAAAAPGAAVAGTGAPGDAAPHSREAAAVAWALAFVGGIWLLGFVAAVPLFILAYFRLLYRRPWPTALGAALAMGGFTYFVFGQLLGVHLAAGMVWRWRG